MTTSIASLYTRFCQHPVVCTDSRKITPGCIFFALKGENFDANSFALDALHYGAAYSVVDCEEFRASVNPKLLWVPNVLECLQQLAAHHRRQLDIPVIALTGTNGKTTTKELVHAVLSSSFRVTATQGNFNNHIGVPLSLLRLNAQTQIGLIEMGASHPGEIDELVRLVQPTIGLITNVGKAHLEGFGSLEGVMTCKGALYDYLITHNGHIFYNTEEPLLKDMLEERKILFPSDSCTPYGTSLQPTQCTQHNGALCAQIEGYPLIQTHLIGQYNIHNILAALALGQLFEVTPQKAADAIGAYLPTNNRSQWLQTAHNTLVVDAYNANPSSMAASLDTFEQFPSEMPKCLILGDMRELGGAQEQEHERIVNRVYDFLGEASKTTADGMVFWVGPNFTLAASKAASKAVAFCAQCFPDVESLAEHLRQHPVTNHTVLIKGSNSLHLTQLKDIL